MPVQINEMIIRANIVEGQEQQTSEKPTGSTEVNKEEIIKECTAIIMEMINNKHQR
jgi:hypothetical protein